MKILITGGTVFVSRFITSYFVKKEHEVYVLNRGNHSQVTGANLIKADRNNLDNRLCNMKFDAVIDVCGYNDTDIKNLLSENFSFDDYVFISSSAVYPNTHKMPLKETTAVGYNSIWGEYGTNKIKAENYLLEAFPKAYILRPPYLYGPMQNLYRESFVFDCAEQGRKFFIPKEGKMKLQFFHVEDLCKMIEAVLIKKPSNHIFNVGNSIITDINAFAKMCYMVVNAPLEKVYVGKNINQRDYFPFYDYEYILDVSLQKELLEEEKDLLTGFMESYQWYRDNKHMVVKKSYMTFIDCNLK